MIESKLLRRANLNIVISETPREYAVAMGAPQARTMVIRTGIDPKRHNPEVDRNNIRSEYGIDREDKVLLVLVGVWLSRGERSINVESSRWFRCENPLSSHE